MKGTLTNSITICNYCSDYRHLFSPSWAGSDCGEDLLAGLDLDDSVAACGAYEFLDAPAGFVFDPVADGQGGEHYREVGLDRLPCVAVDRAGLQVVFGHAKALLDTPLSSVGRVRECTPDLIERSRTGRSSTAHLLS